MKILKTIIIISYVAAQEGHRSTIELLIKRGADLEFTFREGFTPLYVASQRGNVGNESFFL